MILPAAGSRANLQKVKFGSANQKLRMFFDGIFSLAFSRNARGDAPLSVAVIGWCAEVPRGGGKASPPALEADDVASLVFLQSLGAFLQKRNEKKKREEAFCFWLVHPYAGTRVRVGAGTRARVPTAMQAHVPTRERANR
jgi:hypothetical protein